MASAAATTVGRRGALAGLVLWPLAARAAAEARLLRIGTGSVSGTYYPIGSLVADIISNPPGSRPCEQGGDCGVPGLVAVAQSSDGSVANIEAIQRGELESGFAQSDVAHGAYFGTGVFAGRPPARLIRAIANLYPEAIHIVVLADGPIQSVRDLAGRRVSLDREGSGTRVDARLILETFGLSETVMEVSDVRPSEAIDLMLDGHLDAFFIVAGAPTAGVAELAERRGIRLLPLAGPEVAELIRRYPFFSYDLIPFGAYPGVPSVETISVGAQWLVVSLLEEDFVYDILRAFWRPEARPILDIGHPKGREITLENALDGIAIPLHPGAVRYYREAGLMP
jgi:TRAP transporter TAXI family solute receptor